MAKEAIEQVKSDEEWEACYDAPGLKVVDVYVKWAGACDALSTIFRRVKQENGDNVSFYQVYRSTTN
jgi:hypothetical protein